MVVGVAGEAGGHSAQDACAEEGDIFPWGRGSKRSPRGRQPSSKPAPIPAGVLVT